MYCSSSARNCLAMSRRSLPENVWSVSRRPQKLIAPDKRHGRIRQRFHGAGVCRECGQVIADVQQPPRSYDMYRKIVLFHPNAFRHRRPPVAEHVKTSHRFSFVDDVLSGAIPGLDHMGRARAPSAIGPCRQWTMRLQRTGVALGVARPTRDRLRVGPSAFHLTLTFRIRTRIGQTGGRVPLNVSAPHAYGRTL